MSHASRRADCTPSSFDAGSGVPTGYSGTTAPATAANSPSWPAGFDCCTHTSRSPTKYTLSSISRASDAPPTCWSRTFAIARKVSSSAPARNARYASTAAGRRSGLAASTLRW